LREGLGPDWWLLVDAVTVNVNTAEIEDLLQLPGIERGAAERALTSRRAAGPFTDVRDFIARGGLDAKSAQSVEQAASAMNQAGTYLRR
jgi:DNA uptake protein ComE-like DNA-binding protein